MAQRIVHVKLHSPAARYGIKDGETLVSIDRTPVLDQVDYQFLSVRRAPVLRIRDEQGEERDVQIAKREEEAIGLTLESTLMSCPKTCANHCMFCFIEQMPPGMRESLYVRDDDWRLSLISGNFVTLTNLPERELERIIARKASPLYISVHTTNPELRKKMLHHIRADRIMEHLNRFKENGIRFHCQIVLCPGINDGDELRRTLSDLVSLYPASFTAALVPVGLTRYREGLYPLRPYTREEAKNVLAIARSVQEQMLRDHGTRFVFPSDEFYQLAGEEIPAAECYEDFHQIENGVGLLARFRDEWNTALWLDPDESENVPRRVVMATGTSVAPFMRALIEKNPITSVNIEVRPILNDFFGHTVTVSGLITGQDLVAQLKGVDADEILITRSMLREGDDAQIFLDDMTLDQVQRAIGVRVRPVDNDGASLLYALRGMEE